MPVISYDEALADVIQNFRRQGRWVIAKYEDGHTASVETFPTAAGAFEVFSAPARGLERTALYTPLGEAAPYAVEHTLGQYIARKADAATYPRPLLNPGDC